MPDQDEEVAGTTVYSRFIIMIFLPYFLVFFESDFAVGGELLVARPWPLAAARAGNKKWGKKVGFLAMGEWGRA